MWEGVSGYIMLEVFFWRCRCLIDVLGMIIIIVIVVVIDIQ